MDQSNNLGRPSGIPRLSKLPVPKSTPGSSLSASRLRPPTSTDTLQRKTSQTSLKAPLSTSSSRRASGVAAPPASRISSTSTKAPTRKDEGVFKKPSARPPSRQARTQTHTQRVTSQKAQQGQERDDVLGSLDGFRSSSRASSRLSMRDDEPEDRSASQVPQELAPRPKRSRPSLSDRTIESLANVPPSPGPRRRGSNFFTPESPMRPPSRSSSSLGHHRRPSTSDGNASFSASVSRAPGTPSTKTENLKFRGSLTGPGKRSLSAAITKKPSQTLRQPSAAEGTPSKHASKTLSSSFRGSRTVTGSIAPRTRPSLNGLFDHPNTERSPSTSRAPKITPKPSPKIALKSSPKADAEDSGRAAPKSSSALREHIAKAKAAKKAATSKQPSVDNESANSQFDFDLADDPFNQLPKGGEAVLQARVNGARSSGRLKIAALGLKEIPEAVLNMYEYDPNQSDSTAWAEVVDLVRFDAADNDLEEISDVVFPDIDVQSLSFDEDAPSTPFMGIENLDLHGNILKIVPLGLRRMHQLSSLNLSRNRLTTTSIEILSQVPNLKELKLSENNLEGNLPDSIGKLQDLQVLELEGNRLTGLPDEVRELVSLRVLNLNSNRLESLDIMNLLELPLVQLSASKNRLDGILIPDAAISNTTLQSLNVSGNSLRAMTAGESPDFPALQTLDVSANRLESLPSISMWVALISLYAQENKIQSIPHGFADLSELRTADFSSNDVTILEERIGLMENLDSFRIAANPLRERKFLTMDTSELKQKLKAKSTPATQDEVGLEALSGEIDGSAGGPASKWKLQSLATLDLSKQELNDLPEEDFRHFAEENDVKQLNLQHNLFEMIPATISFASRLTGLDLSHNKLKNPLQASLSLPHLRTLNLAGNGLTANGLEQFCYYLQAPGLQVLDLNNNALSGDFPLLPAIFSSLVTVLAADNAYVNLDAESLRGLKTVDLSGNALDKLDPRIGLLAGHLTSLNVDGNTFRVPNYHTLKKGTDAVLSWLRDRLPEDQQEGFE